MRVRVSLFLILVAIGKMARYAMIIAFADAVWPQA